MSAEELGRLRKRLDYAVMQLEREAKFLPSSRPENRRFHRAFSAVTEVRNALVNIHCAQEEETMSIHCGHCGGRHESVAEIRECSLREDDNTTMNPVVPDPGDAPSYVAAFQQVPDFEGDPWEGATESDPGVWSPGPAAYLNARREPPRDPSGHYPATQPQSEEWAGYKKAVEELTEGFYAFDEGIYQAVMSGKGRLYAKALNEDTGTWSYSAGTIMKLKPEMRLKLDDAKAFGHRTGRCGCCGRTLTNPASIELGIGPICAERYF